MKKLFILFAFFVLPFFSSAQYVTLQDTAFRNWIDVNYPGAIVGGQLDINNIGVITACCIFASGGYDFYNLDGVQYFTNLQVLQASGVQLDFVPQFILPPTVTTIDFSNNNLTSLSGLPSGNILDLDVSSNQFSGIFNVPVNLTHLNVSGNNITGINFNNNNSLVQLYAPSNSIASISNLPDSLRFLNLAQNQFASLPSLPTGLWDLTVWNNSLDSLPELPATLNSLSCQNNQLNCLPFLPDTLTMLNYSGNNITCFPNYNAQINSGTGNFPPLCNSTNSCPSYLDSIFLNTVTVAKTVCSGDSNAQLNLSTQGINPPYTYLWSTGQTTSSINNLSAGLYSATVTDSIGNASVFHYTILEPPPINLFYLVNHTNPPGTATGSINLLVGGGVGPYNYLWSTGETTEDIQNLAPGVYTVTINDAHGCANLQTIIIN